MRGQVKVPFTFLVVIGGVIWTQFIGTKHLPDGYYWIVLAAIVIAAKAASSCSRMGWIGRAPAP
jgi:hypothetical protein